LLITAFARNAGSDAVVIPPRRGCAVAGVGESVIVIVDDAVTGRAVRGEQLVVRAVHGEPTRTDEGGGRDGPTHYADVAVT